MSDSKTLVFLPAYDEEQNILRILNRLHTVCPHYDCLVIDDGSRDATAKVCEDAGICSLIRMPKHEGLTTVFQTALSYAAEHSYQQMIQLDGDGQHRPEYIPALMEAAEDGADLVIGSRFLTEKKPASLRMFGSNLLQFLIRRTTGKRITDPTCGMRLFDADTIRLLASNPALGPDPDMLVWAMRNGVSVREVPVVVDERMSGRSYFSIRHAIPYMWNMCTHILKYGRRPRTEASE